MITRLAIGIVAFDLIQRVLSNLKLNLNGDNKIFVKDENSLKEFFA